MKKKLFSLALALSLCLCLTVPAFAAELKIVEVPVPTVEEYEGEDYLTSEFHEGLARLWLYKAGSGIPVGTGFVDWTGAVVVSPTKYDGAWDFSNGFARVQKSNRWGFIDKTGKEITPLQYSNAGDFSEGFAAVVKGGGVGFIDQTGQEVIPFAYTEAKGFSQGLAAVTVNGKRGYINKTGKVVIPCKYGVAGPFSGGFAAVAAYDANIWGFIDKTGKEVVPPEWIIENGEKYCITGGFVGMPNISDGYAYMRRWYTDSSKNIPDDTCFYFAITVDAKVSDWAREQVDSAAVKGLMPDGLGDDFTEKITRAEFAALAVKLYEAMSGQEAPAPGESPFSDTSDAVIIQANALGIVNGKGEGKFAPSALVTRQEAALMLSRVYTKLGGTIPEVAATTFADNDKVAGWARDAVAFMSGKEIVNGVGGNRFDPTGNASIEQAMVIALRMLEDLK